jgi:hypothetical protein
VVPGHEFPEDAVVIGFLFAFPGGHRRRVQHGRECSRVSGGGGGGGSARVTALLRHSFSAHYGTNLFSFPACSATFFLEKVLLPPITIICFNTVSVTVFLTQNHICNSISSHAPSEDVL